MVSRIKSYRRVRLFGASIVTLSLLAIGFTVPSIATATTIIPAGPDLAKNSASEAGPGGRRISRTGDGSGPAESKAVGNPGSTAAPRPGDSDNRCTRPAPTGSVFGTSLSTSTMNGPKAVAALDQHFGMTVPALRVFDPGMVGEWSRPRTPVFKGRTLIMSFRPSPKEVLSGQYDAAFKAWFNQAPADSTIYWSYVHEPESKIRNGDFTADEYRAAWRRLDAIADSVCRQNMYATLILTGWTTESASKQEWQTYYPGGDVIDVMAFDPYNGVYDPGRTYYRSPESLYGNPLRVAREAGKPFAIAETGSRIVVGDSGGRKRAEWLADMADYLRANNALFVTYFHSTRDGHWLLDDAVSRDSWTAQMRRSKK